MKENIETCLEDRIRYLFEELESVEFGSEEYLMLSAELQRLYDIRNDEIKIHADEAKASDADEREIERLEFEKIKAEEEKRRGIKDRVVAVGSTVFTTLSSIFLAKKIMKFEEEGVLTSKSWNQCVPKIRWK
jgi:hypothetical protein